MSDVDPFHLLKSNGWIHYSDKNEELVINPKQVDGIRLNRGALVARGDKVSKTWNVELLLKSLGSEHFSFATEEERTDFVRFVANLI